MPRTNRAYFEEIDVWVPAPNVLWRKQKALNSFYSLHLFPVATLTNYHNWMASDNRNLFSCSFEAWYQKSKNWQSRIPSGRPIGEHFLVFCGCWQSLASLVHGHITLSLPLFPCGCFLCVCFLLCVCKPTTFALIPCLILLPHFLSLKIIPLIHHFSKKSPSLALLLGNQTKLGL